MEKPAPAAQSVPKLEGLRVLVVEDEMMIALLIEDMLSEYGCRAVETAGRLGHALDAARTQQVDLAILDLNLGGEPAYPVAEVLAERGIPFVFTTGYGVEGIAPAWRERPTIAKPFKPDQLVRSMRDALAA